jgi:NAD(P)-dependent dehydrogenase (short-subunit alcohol dehydrogenase family)
VSTINSVDTPDLSRSKLLQGQVAFVTGASSGLGRQFSMVLASAGAAVVLAGRRQGKLEEVRTAIDALGGVAMTSVLDVAQADEIAPAIDSAESLGPVRILVNCAGIPHAQRAHKLSLETIDCVIATNLRAPYILSCEIARRLIERSQSGRIVNISSVVAYHYHGSSAASMYSITKAALDRMTEVLALEWARYGINVNAIAPGFFDTEMMDGMIHRIGDPRSSFPRKRLGDPSQLDSTLLYLVDPSSDFITGTVIRADDAQVAR